MRRLALILAALSVLIAGCGSSQHAHLWVSAPHRYGDFECVSTDCGPWTATLNFQIPSYPGQTGYWLFLNGVKVGSASSSPFVFRGWDCGVTDTLGVEAHDSAGNHGPLWTMSHTSPACVGPNYYVAQSAAGTGSGSSCANAAAVSTLSTSTEWTPGNVIGLCGTITSTITAQGSGTSSQPITVYWEPGATISEAVCPTTGCFNTNSKTYLTLDGGSNGSVQATANGSGLANQAQSNGIVATACTGCTIKNLTVENIYQHTSSSDSNGNAQSTSDISITGSNYTVANNTLDNANTGVYDDPGASDSTDLISGNNVYDANWGVALARQSSGGTIGPVYIYGNHFHDWTNWDTTADTFHHNGIYCYTGSSVTTLPHYTGIYVYNNTFDGADSNNATALIWPGGSPGGNENSNPACADSTTPWYIFNNVLQPSGSEPGDGSLYPTCCTDYVYNNTLVGPTNASGFLMVSEYGGTLDMVNNLFDNGNTLVKVDTTTITFSPKPDYDFFANGGGSAFECNGTFGFPSGFANWQTCSGGDTHGQAYSGTFTLNADGSLPAGNPAIGAGENLYSTCNGQPNPGLGALCENISGTARPSSGAWNAGAY